MKRRKGNITTNSYTAYPTNMKDRSHHHTELFVVNAVFTNLQVYFLKTMTANIHLNNQKKPKKPQEKQKQKTGMN